MFLRIPHDNGTLFVNLRNIDSVMFREGDVYIHEVGSHLPWKVTLDEWRRASKTPHDAILGIRTANPPSRPVDERRGAEFAVLEG